jgi:cobalt-zinc-cadmium efflux system outer membrane protein
MVQVLCALLLCAALLTGPLCAQELPLPTPARLEGGAALASPHTITLEYAIRQALERSPVLKSSQAAADASKGAQRQAGAFPNPDLGIEADNVGGAGTYRGFDSAEVTLGVTQLVEIGGKRSARQARADHEHAIAHAELAAARLDLIRDVKIAYVEAVAAGAAVALAEKEKSLASEILQNVTKRVNAAAEPLFQKSKSEVALATSEIALDKARRDYTIARKRLAALWGSGDTDFSLDSSRFFELTQPQRPPAVRRFADNPMLLRWQAEVARSEAGYALEQANAIPDPRLSAGVKEFRATDERALVVGVSIPIPVFDRNGGNIARARSEVTKAASGKRSAEITLDTELTRSQQELENAYREAQVLKTRIIPSAEEAYRLSRQGYGAGKFPYLEVLDAQRTLVGARAQYNDSLKTYHSKYAEVERLTASYTPEPNQKDDAHAD